MSFKDGVLEEMGHKTGYKMSDEIKAAKVFKECMSHLDPGKEHFLVSTLTTKNKIINTHVVSIGSLNANITHPREVYFHAIQDKAMSIIVAHNHPSGDPAPSQSDIDITHRLWEAGNILGIELHDHIIVGNPGFKSMKSEGKLKPPNEN